MRTSVLTLVRGREAHLANLLRGLARQTLKPDELVIAWMQDEAFDDLPDPGCPVRHVFVAGEPMPLARARNRAAEAAAGDLLVFLDVDCLPSPTTVAGYGQAAGTREGLFLGEVYYLPAGAVRDGELDFASLDAAGRTHPAKPAVPAEGLREEPDAGELWGLSFALPRRRYLAVGGMDESFVGYGAEETDFAVRVSASGLPFFWTANARAYHQYHIVSVPPLQHFDHIVRNAELFRAKHGRWCMDYWLGQFRDQGLVAWDEKAARIEILRHPDPGEIASAKQDAARLFS